MVNYYEEILIFTKKYEVGKDIKPQNPVYKYLKNEKKESGITTKEFNLMYSNYKGKIKNKDRSIGYIEDLNKRKLENVIV